VTGSGQEVLARWHDEGVDAFARPTLTARPLLEQFGARVRALAARADAERQGTRPEGESDAVGAPLATLIAETAAAAQELAARVAEGRDRLLELASLRHDVAAALIDGVAALDGDRALEDLFLRVLEHAHVYAEEIGDRCYLLNPDGVRGDDLPALGAGESAVTFDRETALVREDLVFLTADHPLLHDAMELLLASEAGNASFALAATDDRPHLRLEMVFVLEAVAPRRLHVDRFLPPTPVHVGTDQTLVDVAPVTPSGVALPAGRGRWIAEHRAALAPLLARMTAACTARAEERAQALRATATSEVCARLDAELARLRALAQVNDHVRPAELTALEHERAALVEHIVAARLRPDAARLVWHGPHRGGEPATG
jgi:ATP-dependent helicase HepA